MILRPELDANSDQPLYRQLYAHFRAEILAGRLSRGERVPPTRELAGQLGLNRTTIAAAYELLESEGLIRGHVGRGSYVEGPENAVPSIRWEDRFSPTAEDHPSTPPVPDGAIDFTSSRPAAELFPMEEFRATTAEVAGDAGAAQLLQLGSPFGHEPLRRYLLEDGRAHGVVRPSDSLVVTSGCQQALDLLQRLFTASGDSVLIEDPVYPGLRRVFENAGVRCLGVPISSYGPDFTTLERHLDRERPKLFVTTPNFHNPTGWTMPLSARRAVLAIAREAGVIVVENDIYGELRYQGDALPSLKALDESGSVLQVGSFSKITFPGLRVGWVIAPDAVAVRLAEWKQITDLHSDQLSQAILLRFAESGRLAAHKAHVLGAGAERLAALLDALAREMPEGTRWSQPEGGMNAWVQLPGGIGADEVLRRSTERGVVFLPGRYFAVSRVQPGALRLSFAGLEPALIRDGIAVLGAVIREELEARRRQPSASLAPAIV